MNVMVIVEGALDTLYFFYLSTNGLTADWCFDREIMIDKR